MRVTWPSSFVLFCVRTAPLDLSCSLSLKSLETGISAECAHFPWTKHGFMTYVLVDSSPQFGFDFVNIVKTTVTVNHAMEAWGLLQDLHALAATLAVLGKDTDRHLEASQLKHQSLVADIVARLVVTRATPTLIGSGRGSVYHKFHALWHSVVLETSTQQEAKMLLESAVSFTTDMGTELKLTSFPSFQCSELMPWKFAGAAGMEVSRVPVDPCLESEQVHTEHFDPWVHLEALTVSGLLHVLHNATENLRQVMPHFVSFAEQLSTVCSLLSAKHSKQRFLSTCLPNLPVVHPEVIAVQQFSARVYQGRWGSITDAVLALHGQVGSILRSHWSKEAFSFGSEKQQSQKSTDIGAVDTAVTSGWCKVTLPDPNREAPLCTECL